MIAGGYAAPCDSSSFIASASTMSALPSSVKPWRTASSFCQRRSATGVGSSTTHTGSLAKARTRTNSSA